MRYIVHIDYEYFYKINIVLLNMFSKRKREDPNGGLECNMWVTKFRFLYQTFAILDSKDRRTLRSLELLYNTRTNKEIQTEC